MKKLYKALKIILVILILILIFILVTFIINKKRVEQNKDPLPFTMYIKALYKDGGSRVYVGLGYKINRYFYSSYSGLTNTKIIYEIGDYNLKFDNKKNMPLDTKFDRLFYEYYYDVEDRIENKENEEKMSQMFQECYEKYKETYGDNKSKETIEKSIRKYFNLDDSYILYNK